MRHPLQPFDARNFVPGGSRRRPAVQLRPRRAGRRRAAARVRAPPAPPFLHRAAAARAADRDDVNLADLRDFLVHPVRAFLRRRLDVAAPLEDDEVGDAIPVDLDALEQWAIGDRLLREVLAGARPGGVLIAEQLRGTLPPGGLGDAAARRRRRARRRPLFARDRASCAAARPRSVDVDVDLGDGRRLTGTVAGRLRRPAASPSATPGSSRGTGSRAWVDLLAAQRRPPRPHVHRATPSAAAGPARSARSPGRSTTAPIDWLRDLVELRDPGCSRAAAGAARRPGCAWAEARATELPGRRRIRCAAAARAWETDRRQPHRHPRRARRRRPRPGLGRPRAASHAAARRRAGASAPPGSTPRSGSRCSPRRAGGTRCDDTPTRRPPRPFDIRDPLPTGTTLLEASAGTGKTWTIGALVTRYVAEGARRLDEMLIVTFGRAASQELRERVRAQLVEAERALADDRPGDARRPSLVDAAAATRADELRARRHRGIVAGAGRLRRRDDRDHPPVLPAGARLASASPATPTPARGWSRTSTTCSARWSTTSTSARSPTPRATPVFATPRRCPSPARRSATRRPGSSLPTPTPATPHGRRVAFAEAVRAELERRKRRLGVLCYDDLLSQLADALDRDDDAPARARMRQRWRVVLVDEFQDTDPVQWQVLDRAFCGHATMVLIGDPKQAIYAFRGGDVVTYLDAADDRRAPSRRSASTGAATQRAARRRSRRCCGAPRSATTRIVVRDVAAHHDGPPARGRAPSPTRSGSGSYAATSSAGAARAPLTVGQVRPLRRRRPRPRRPRAARPRRDLRRPAAASRATSRCIALPPRRPRRRRRRRSARVGVPAVIAGGGSVFATPAADEWLPLLEALEQPHRSARVRAAALTSFFGRTAADLDGGGDGSPTRSPRRCAPGPRCFADARRRGGARGGRRAGRAARPGAGRASAASGMLTDLRHIGEALHEVGLTERLGARRDARVAARARSPRTGRSRRRAHPPARQRRRRRPAGDDPRQQGTAVPRRLPARRSPTARARRRRRRSSTTTRAAAASTSAAAAATAGATTAALGARGGRRGAAAPLRRADPRPVAGRRVVGSHPQHARPRRSTGCSRAAAPAPADVPDALRRPHRRRGRATIFAHWQAAGGPVVEPAVPERAGRRGAAAGADRASPVRAFDRDGRHRRGAVRRTPR